MFQIYTFIRQYRAFFYSLHLLIFSFFAGAVYANELPLTVKKALTTAGIDAKNIAVFVQEADTGNVHMAYNSKQPMNPASVMKLVTTYSALDILGPTYVWKTEVFADASPVDGRLAGNLYLRGSGAPDMSVEQFWLMLQRLSARGIKNIDGDLVLDRSAFSLPPHDPGAFDNQPLRPYNAGPDALLVNLKSLQFVLQADSVNKSVSIITETPTDGLQISNKLKLTEGACVDWNKKFKVTVKGRVIEFEGNYAASCKERNYFISPWDSNIQLERLFRRLWRELGGTLKGKVKEGRVSAGAQSILIQESKSLTEVIRDINKYSNNVMARQLFLTIDPNHPSTTDGAEKQLQSWLTEKGMNMPELVMENGSGLSRVEQISAEGMAALLIDAWKNPYMPEFVASLPIAAADGTLGKRFRNSVVAGRAHLKTGYLEGVRAISGYALDMQGKMWVVVVMINDPKALGGKAVIDEMLAWVIDR